MIPNLDFIRTMLNGIRFEFNNVENKFIEVYKSIAEVAKEFASKKYVKDTINDAVKTLATTKYVDNQDAKKQDDLCGCVNQIVGFSASNKAFAQDMNFALESPNGTVWDFEVSDDGVLSLSQRESIIDQYLEGSMPERYVNPYVTEIRAHAFAGLGTVKILDLPAATSINGIGAFTDNRQLEAIIFRRTDRPVTSSDEYNFLDGLGSGGYAYVPKSLLNEYNSEYPYYKGHFRAIEDYPEITGG